MSTIGKWEIVGIIFVVVVGTLIHFVYGWSGDMAVVGALAPVNESTWEHLKLLFTPYLLISIVEFCLAGRRLPGFFDAKAAGAVAGLGTIVALFYTYSGIIGKNYLWADILTFIIGVAVAYAVSLRRLKTYRKSERGFGVPGVIILALFLVAFVVFTFYPPHIGLFLDPVTGGYGI